MDYWKILSRDPLIFRNGKPFSAAPGSRAETLPMPFPSTIAGAVRTMAGRDPATGEFQKDKIPNLLQKSVYSPILIELDPHNRILDFFLPAPEDALILKSNDPESPNHVEVIDLRPLNTGEIEVDLDNFKICGPSVHIKGKSLRNAPSFWRWDVYKEWLLAAQTKRLSLEEMGIVALSKETRTHIKIDPQSQTSESGALFQTSGLEFMYLSKEDDADYRLSEVRRFGIFVITDAEISSGMGHLGGERRIVRWEPAEKESFPLQRCPEKIKDMALADGYCRLLLITPAYFEKGFTPSWLQKAYGVEVKAVINRRYQGVSGWDYATQKPKPTRRLMPAGSVIFLSLPDDKKRRETFVNQIWLKPISDDEQSQRDGFGLSLLGAWNGAEREMNTEVLL